MKYFRHTHFNSFKVKITKSFTLLELIIVVVIIGVFAISGSVMLEKFTETNRIERIKTNLRAIHSSGTIFHAKHGDYPDTDCNNLECINNMLRASGCDIIPEPNIHYEYQYAPEALVKANNTIKQYSWIVYLDSPIEADNPLLDTSESPPTGP